MMRRRASGVAASTLLAIALAATTAGATTPADTPEGAVHDLLDAVHEERFDAFADLVCEEHRSTITDRFDVRIDLPPDVGDGVVELDVLDRIVELVDQAGDTAEVRVSGHLSVFIDEALVREMAELSLGLLGDAIESEQIDELTAQLLAQLAEGSPIDDTVTVVGADGRWLVCDDIATGDDVAAAAATSIEGMCASMSVPELDAIDEEQGGRGFDAYARSSWDEETGLCTYDKGPDGIGTVEVGRFEFPFDDISAALPDAIEETVAGRRAYLRDNDLFVELADGGHLYVNAPGKGTADGEIDYLSMPAAVAELVLPRLPDEG